MLVRIQFWWLIKKAKTTVTLKKKKQKTSGLNKAGVYFSLLWQPECEPSGADVLALGYPDVFYLVLPALAYDFHVTIQGGCSISHHHVHNLNSRKGRRILRKGCAYHFCSSHCPEPGHVAMSSC